MSWKQYLCFHFLFVYDHFVIYATVHTLLNIYSFDFDRIFSIHLNLNDVSVFRENVGGKLVVCHMSIKIKTLEFNGVLTKTHHVSRMKLIAYACQIKSLIYLLLLNSLLLPLNWIFQNRKSIFSKKSTIIYNRLKRLTLFEQIYFQLKEILLYFVVFRFIIGFLYCNHIFQTSMHFCRLYIFCAQNQFI